MEEENIEQLADEEGFVEDPVYQIAKILSEK